MKVVLFCGGQGLRIREYAENIPKPMVPIGYRPIMWHLMKYYAHHGHTDFILCLGYRGDTIKDYFLKYDECASNDFVLSEGGRNVKLLGRDIDGWSITFVDTGNDSNIGTRLRAVREHLRGEEMFLANYSDNLSDLPLPAAIGHFREQPRAVASFVSVKPSQSFHFVEVGPDGQVSDIYPANRGDHWINGGFFCFRQSIFDVIGAGEELVHEPFRRLMASRQLISYRHGGFWAAMDTFKERQVLEDLYARGNAPWQVWKTPAGGPADAR